MWKKKLMAYNIAHEILTKKHTVLHSMQPVEFIVWKYYWGQELWKILLSHFPYRSNKNIIHPYTSWDKNLQGL